MKKENLEGEVKLNFLEVKEELRVRVSGNKKAKKLINRIFGTRKKVAKFLSKQLDKKEGTVTLTAQNFLELINAMIEEKLTLIDSVLKSIKKQKIEAFEDINWEDMPIDNVQAKRAARKFFE